MFSDRRLLAAALLALLVAVVGVTDLRPVLNDNEAVRLIPGVRLWDPSQFDGDWSFEHADPSSKLFDGLVAAMLQIGPPTLIALGGRVAMFGVLLYLVWRLATRVGTPAHALFAGLCGWYLLGQTAVAGEWIVRGFEPKVFSYAFLLAAMLAYFEDRRIAGAAFLALTFVAHPFVGLWGGGSLVAALVTERRREGSLLSAAILAALAIVGVVLFLYAEPFDMEDMRLYVHFRNPHHLDPVAFGSRAQILLGLIALGVVILSRARASVWTLLDRWLFFVNLSFAAGLLAWALDFTPLLATYPFRIAPMADLLAACVLIAEWVFDRTSIRAWTRFAIVSALAASCAFRVWDRHYGFEVAWKSFVTRTDQAHRPIVSWLRSNTGKDALAALPPEDVSLWFLSGRPQFVSFKYHPPQEMSEWLERLKALNGGKDFSGSGFGAMAELRANYPRLASADLVALRDQYHVRYYVTTMRRDDLVRAEVFSDPPYNVYDLARLDTETMSSGR